MSPESSPPAKLAAEDVAAEPIFVPWLIALLAWATLAKLAGLACTRGSGDAENWFFFALHGQRWGVFDAYIDIGTLCNHPPLAILIESSVVGFGKALGHILGYAPDHYPGTPFFWLRLPALGADLASLLLLAPLLRTRMGARRTRLLLAALAVSPLTFVVGVWHGNTDLIWIALLLAAIVVLEWPFALKPVYRLRVGPLRLADLPLPSADVRAVAAGVLVALGTAIKTPAVVGLAPLFLVAQRGNRGALLLLGFVVPAAAFVLWGFVGGGYPFVECVLGYRGTLTAMPWPVERFAREFLGEGARDWLVHHGHVLVGTAAAAAALVWARRGGAGEAVAVTYAATLLVLPVFGCPYLLWVALPLALLGARAVLLFHLAAFLEAAVIYLFPIDKFMSAGEAAAAFSVGPALCTWLLLLGIVVLATRGRPVPAA